MRLTRYLGVTGLVALIGVTAAMVGCKSSSTPEASAEKPAAAPTQEATSVVGSQQAPHKPTSASPAGDPHGGAAELGVTWSDPEGWEKVAAKNPMRAAEYRVPAVEGDPEPAEVTASYFGAKMGGGVADNLDRWAQQFKGVDEADVKRTTRENKGLTHHLIQIPKGEFAGMSMMGGATPAKPNYGLLGAVTVAPSGKYFFKMTGPSKTVAANQAAFESLLESVKSK